MLHHGGANTATALIAGYGNLFDDGKRPAAMGDVVHDEQRICADRRCCFVGCDVKSVIGVGRDFLQQRFSFLQIDPVIAAQTSALVEIKNGVEINVGNLANREL